MRGFTKGDRILHGHYGTGTLIDVNESRTVIDFDAHGIHRFVTSMVVLEPTDAAAPPRRARSARKDAAGKRPRSG